MIKIKESKDFPLFTELKCGDKKCIFDNRFFVRFCTEFHFTNGIENIKQIIYPLSFDSIIEDRDSFRLCLMLKKRGVAIGTLLFENKESEDLKIYFKGFNVKEIVV